MVVQPVVRHDLPRPVVETLDPRLPGARIGEHPAHPAGRGKLVLALADQGLVLRPQAGPSFEVAFEVGAPEHLLHELFRAGAVGVEGGGHGLLLRHHPAAEIGGQGGGRGFRVRPVVGVAPGGVGLAHAGGEGAQAVQPGGASGGEDAVHGTHMGRGAASPSRVGSGTRGC